MEEINKLFNKYEYILSFFLFLIVYVITYGVVVSADYAFSDDYTFFNDMGHSNPMPLIIGIVQGGRPIYAIYSLIFSLAGDISDLGWIRLISIFGISSFALLMYHNLKRYTNIPLGVIYPASVACGLSPAFQVYSAWTVTSIFPWAASLAGLSALSLPEKTDFQRVATSLALLVCAVFIYQPAGMVFWAFLLPRILLRGTSLNQLKLMIRSLFVMGAALVVDFGSSKILPRVFFSDLPQFNRSALVTDYVGKAEWFLEEVIPNALNLFSISPNVWHILLVVLMIIAACIVKFNRPLIVIKNLSIVGAIIILSYLPNLIIKESWASYRSQVGLDSVIIILVFMSIYELCYITKLKFVCTVIPCIYLTIGCFVAHRNVNEYFVKPQVKELTLVENYLLSQRGLYQAQKFYLVPSSWKDQLSPVLRYDEFGLPSSMQVWVPQGMAWAILEKTSQGVPIGLGRAIVGKIDDAPHKEDILILNMGDALKYLRTEKNT